MARDDLRYDRASLPPISWSEEAEDHIVRHGVLPEEVQQALYTRPRWIAPGRGETTLVYAMTDAGRYLLVVIAPALDGVSASAGPVRFGTTRAVSISIAAAMSMRGSYSQCS